MLGSICGDDEPPAAVRQAFGYDLPVSKGPGRQQRWNRAEADLELMIVIGPSLASPARRGIEGSSAAGAAE